VWNYLNIVLLFANSVDNRVLHFSTTNVVYTSSSRFGRSDGFYMEHASLWVSHSTGFETPSTGRWRRGGCGKKKRDLFLSRDEACDDGVKREQRGFASRCCVRNSWARAAMIYDLRNRGVAEEGEGKKKRNTRALLTIIKNYYISRLN